MNYQKLFLMTILSFISMYILMYMMVDNISNVYMNLNQFYMAAIMTTPMLIIEIILMNKMYTNKKLNFFIISMAILSLCILTICIRKQIGIRDKEFLKSMIPHHAGAILMCNESKLKDKKIKNLCENIVEAQKEEIAFMKSQLKN